jgi:anti-sigma28 factor (negative regulator of flagellin synthesis)
MQSIWNLFDCVSDAGRISPDTLNHRYRKRCRTHLANRSFRNTGRLLENSMIRSSQHEMTLARARRERVATIRAAIASGTYYVSAEDLAQKLMCDRPIGLRKR